MTLDTPYTTELARTLGTTLQNAEKRARLMKLTPVCGRCDGCGRYSFNDIDGDRCYGCNGSGHTDPTTNVQRAMVLQAAKESAAAGGVASYIELVHAAKRVRSAGDTVMAAWLATGIGAGYKWLIAAKDPMSRDVIVAGFNDRMHAAFKSVSGVGYRKLPTAAADAVLAAALAEVEAARTAWVAWELVNPVEGA
jgi:hypothetical protein